MKKYILLFFLIVCMSNSFGQTRSIRKALQDSLHYDEWDILNIDASLDVELLPQIKKFTKVRRLFIRNMNEFIPEITKLKNLYQLEIINSTFETLPTNFGDLENLKELDIDANLKELPVSFSKLHKLERLFLNYNKFTEFPLPLTTLSKLSELNLGNNQIANISSEIYKMSSLAGLFLHDNQITSLPMGISKLPQIQAIILSGNPLKTIPIELAENKTLQSIDLGKTFIAKEEQIRLKKVFPKKVYLFF